MNYTLMIIECKASIRFANKAIETSEKLRKLGHNDKANEIELMCLRIKFHAFDLLIFAERNQNKHGGSKKLVAKNQREGGAKLLSGGDRGNKRNDF